jgi:hypothetical protein
VLPRAASQASTGLARAKKGLSRKKELANRQNFRLYDLPSVKADGLKGKRVPRPVFESLNTNRRPGARNMPTGRCGGSP